MAIGLEFCEGSQISRQRQELVERAVASIGVDEPFTHVLFLDDDMRFPAETMQRLLAWNKPFVAANYARRRVPYGMTAQKGGKRVSSLDKMGIEVVDSVGLGIALIDLKVFHAIPRPWFIEGFWKSETGDGYISEDVHFCMKAQKAGFEIHVDHDLSQEVSHVGVKEVTIADSEAEAAVAE